MSVASSPRVLLRVEADDVLMSGDEFGDWKLRTAQSIGFYGGMCYTAKRKDRRKAEEKTRKETTKEG